MKTKDQKRLEAEERNARTDPARRRAVRRGCPTGKRIVPSEKEARAELVGIVMRANLGRPNPNRRECRIYQCPQCHFWHFTSQPAPKRETRSA